MDVRTDGLWSRFRTNLILIWSAPSSLKTTLGAGYWICMLPIDVIKSRQQVLSIGSKVPIRFGSCAKDLYRMAGFKGFYAGLLPMLLRTIPANGALFGLVEYTEPQIRNVLF